MAFSFFKRKKNSEQKLKSIYHHLLVKEVVQETKDAVSVVFAHPENKLTYESGQFLTLIVQIGDKEVRRAYSLSSSPFIDQDLVITVKRVKDGLMSNWLPDNVKTGDKIKVMQPMGSFTTIFNSSNKRHLMFFAGGSGITPIISIIKSTLTQEPESVCTLIYCNRDVDSIIFKEYLEKLATDHQGKFQVMHVLDNPPSGWEGFSGTLDNQMLTKMSKNFPDWNTNQTTYLMCGPEGMMMNVENILQNKKIPKERLFKESFSAQVSNLDKSEEVNLVAREVNVVFDGDNHTFMVEPDDSILESALNKGIDLPYSCQSGLCTACRGKCVSGKVKMDEEEGLTESERKEGYVLTCVGHPLTDDVVIEIG